MGINGADCFPHICRVWHAWLPSHICQHEHLINLLDLKFIQKADKLHPKLPNYQNWLLTFNLRIKM